MKLSIAGTSPRDGLHQDGVSACMRRLRWEWSSVTVCRCLRQEQWSSPPLLAQPEDRVRPSWSYKHNASRVLEHVRAKVRNFSVLHVGTHCDLTAWTRLSCKGRSRGTIDLGLFATARVKITNLIDDWDRVLFPKHKLECFIAHVFAQLEHLFLPSLGSQESNTRMFPEKTAI